MYNIILRGKWRFGIMTEGLKCLPVSAKKLLVKENLMHCTKASSWKQKKIKSIKGYDQLWTPTMISPYLESFFTVRFWPECEVVIFGGTKNINMFLYKIMEVYERLLQLRLLIEIKLCSVIVCCTLYHNLWSPLWRMFNTSGDSLLYHTNHNTAVICTHRLGNTK